MRRALPVLALLIAAGGAAWLYLRPAAPAEAWLGYAEADYVRLAPVQQGRLTVLPVARGDHVAQGDPVFAQDDVADRAARDQAQADLAQAREKLADLQTGGREAEIRQAQADVADMQAAYERVSRDLARTEAVLASGAATRQSADQLRADAQSAKARLEAAKARLALVSDSSGRAHAIAAQQAAVASAEAALRQAQWRLDQRRVAAPEAGIIADTFAQPGEMIPAGTPVVSLLPPGNIRVRFFVPETVLSRLRPGDAVTIACDSCPPGLQARISFIATTPEYTPPVIYSQDTRGNLVFLIEARPDPNGFLLKPGQPVTVRPAGGSGP